MTKTNKIKTINWQNFGAFIVVLFSLLAGIKQIMLVEHQTSLNTNAIKDLQTTFAKHEESLSNKSANINAALIKNSTDIAVIKEKLKHVH